MKRTTCIHFLDKELYGIKFITNVLVGVKVQFLCHANTTERSANFSEFMTCITINWQIQTQEKINFFTPIAVNCGSKWTRTIFRGHVNMSHPLGPLKWSLYVYFTILCQSICSFLIMSCPPYSWNIFIISQQQFSKWQWWPSGNPQNGLCQTLCLCISDTCMSWLFDLRKQWSSNPNLIGKYSPNKTNLSLDPVLHASSHPTT